jgi:hypothetical protein
MSSLHRKPSGNRGRGLLCLACGVLVAMAAGGCQTSAPQTRKTGAEIDPCAERLHEICGHLLLYCSLNGKLPDELSDLKGAEATPLPPLTCPTSGKPYVYNREGLPIPGRQGRLVVYDAAPSPAGKRWGILVDVVAGDRPLSARVILVPESPVFSATTK